MLGRFSPSAAIRFLSRLTGFLRDIMLAAIIGAGPVADAFFVAFRLPNHFRAIFAEGAFNAAFIPAYARIRTQGGPAGAPSRFGDRIFTLLLASQLVLLALALLFTPQVDRAAGAGLFARAATVRARGVADADHVSLSPADHAGDAVERHPQRDASLRRGRRGADPAQCGDDGDAGAGVWFPSAGHAAAWGVLISGVLQAALVGGDTFYAGVMTVVPRACAGTTM